MKKIIYLLFVFTIFSLNIFSQDKIEKKNGEIVEAKILEVGESEIKYKIFTDLEGPTYSVDKDRLKKIIYQNGREETYEGSLKDASLYADQARSAIKLNFLAPLAGYTQISYEKNLKPGRSYELSLGIIGLGKRQKREDYRSNYDMNSGNYTSKTNTFYRGAAGAFVSGGYKFIKLPNFIRNGDKFSHILQGWYAKPEVILGVYGQNEYPKYINQQSTTPLPVEKETVALGAFIINLGRQWVLGDAFLIDLYGGMGYALDNQDNSNGETFLNGYGGNHFALNSPEESGLGFTGGLKVGLLLNKKKVKK